MEFNLTCEKNIPYTNVETFEEEFYGNDDRLTEENIDYLDNYIWSEIERTNGKISDAVWYLIREFDEDFLYTYEIGRETLEYDLYKGWATIMIILQNPSTNNYFATTYTDSGLDTEWPEYEFTRVEPKEKTIITWEAVE